MNRIYNSKIGGVQIDRNNLIINGEKIEIPKNMNTSNITLINNKIYIGGYEFKNGKWVRSLKALWHLFF